MVAVQGVAIESLNCVNATHLQYGFFNVSTSRRPEGDKVAMLKTLQVEEEEKRLEGAYIGDESMRATEVARLLEDFKQNWGAMDNSFMSGAVQEIFYVDPTSRKDGNGEYEVECKEMREQRTTMWNFYTRALVNFPAIVKQVQLHNWAALHRRVGDIFGGDKPTKMVADNAATSRLRKKQGQPASAYVDELLRIHSSIGQQTNPRYKMPDGYLPVHAITALAGDPDYSYVVEEMRKLEKAGGVSIEEIISAVNTRSGELKVLPGGGIKGIGAGGAQVNSGDDEEKDDDGRRHHQKKLPCYNWRDKGKCKFGDDCKFSHDQKIKGKGPGKDGKERKDRRNKGKCIECGSDQHGFSDCKERKQRMETAKKVEDQTAVLTANMASVAAALADIKGQLDSGSDTGSIAGGAARLRAPYAGGGEMAALFVPRKPPGGN